MKRIQLIIFILLGVSNYGISQHYSLYGLEIYNPHLKNPAFTGADKLVQADYLRHSIYYYSGNKASVMAALPGDKDAIGINFENNSAYTGFSSLGGPGEMTIQYYNIGASYSHTFHPSEEIEIHAGGKLNYGKLNFLPASQLTDSTRQYDIWCTTSIGVSIAYKNWELGLSAMFPLVRYKYSLNEENILEREKTTNYTTEFYFFSRYNSQSKRRVTFDPVFGLDCRVGGSKPEWFGYAGGIVQIVNVVGLGITAGSLVSVSANLNILNRAQLILGIYGGEKLFQGRITAIDYSFSPENKNYFVQLRVNL